MFCVQGRFESNSESEVFVRSCSRSSDSSKEHVCGEVFHWKCRLADIYLLKLNFNVKYSWKFWKLYFFFHLFSGTPLSEFRNRSVFISAWKKVFFWECFWKAGHACNINIKINILVNFGQFRNEISPPTKQHVNLEFEKIWSVNMVKIFHKWHCVLGLHPKSIKYKPSINEGTQMQIWKLWYMFYFICQKNIFRKILLKFCISYS